MIRFLLFLLLFLKLILPLAAQDGGKTVSYIRNFTPEEYGTHPRNWDIIQDYRGLMYFANNDGVLEFDAASWRLLPLADGSGAYSLAADQEGRIYVGGEGDLGYLAPDTVGTMHYISLREKIPETYRNFDDRVVHISSTPEGMVFLSDGLIFIYRDDTIEVIRSEDHFFSSVYAKQSLYIVDGVHGFAKVVNGSLQAVPGGELLRSFVTLPYKGKILLVQPRRGLILYDPGSVAVSTPPAERASAFSPLLTRNDDFLKNYDISCALTLKDDRLAFGSIKNGFVLVDSNGQELFHLNQSSGLQNNDVHSIYQDEEENFWLALAQGISFVTPNRVERRFASAQTDSISAVVDTTGTAPFSAIIRGVEGILNDSLVFGGAFYETVDNVQVLQQKEIQSPEFNYDYNAFRFTYSSNYYGESEGIEYECYLEGLELELRTWSTRRVREYTNLYWGEYTLHVRARTPQGEMSRETTYTFRVLPPWHATLWFAAVQVGFVLSLLAISAVLSRYGAGSASKISDNLIVFAVVVIFKYVTTAMSPVIGFYSMGIAFFKLFANAMVAFVLKPAQKLVDKLIRKTAQTK